VVRLYRHATWKVLNKIHTRTLKTGAACFTETTMKIFSAIENPKTYNY
jgi:hypothetical protein